MEECKRLQRHLIRFKACVRNLVCVALRSGGRGCENRAGRAPASHGNRLLALALQVPAWTLTHVREQRVDAGHGDFGLPCLEFVLDFSVFLWDSVQTLHADVSERGRRVGMRHAIAQHAVVCGVGESPEEHGGCQLASRDVNDSLQSLPDIISLARFCVHRPFDAEPARLATGLDPASSENRWRWVEFLRQG